MQLIPETAKRFGVTNVFDAKQNIEGGVKFLKFLMGMFPNNLPYILAAYNAGENAVLKYKGIPPYQETQAYVRKISQAYSKKGSFLVASNQSCGRSTNYHLSRQLRTSRLFKCGQRLSIAAANKPSCLLTSPAQPDLNLAIVK
jgi:hypothetical protein